MGGFSHRVKLDLGELCSKVKPLCYASMLLLLAIMLWIGYCYAPLTGLELN